MALIDSWTTNAGASVQIATGGGGNPGAAQAFTCTDAASLGSVHVLLHKKVGSPTGNIHCKIFASTGTYGTDAKPTGSALGTSDTVIDASTLTTSLVETTFDFSTPVSLSAATKYEVSIDFDSGTWDSTSVGVGSNLGHDGNRAILQADTNWAGYNDTDLNFWAYAAVSGPANLKSYNTNLKANIKSINTNLIANIKTLNTNV